MSSLKKAYIKFCIGKGIEVTEERINIHVNSILATGITQEAAVKALSSLFAKTKFFPDCSEVLAEINSGRSGVKEKALIAANKILKATESFSEYDRIGIKKYLGDLYPIVEQFGFSELCRRSYENTSTLRAQLNRFCEAKIAANESFEKNFGYLPSDLPKIPLDRE